MFGSEILEVAIGLVFVFLIASLAATTVREAIEAVLKTRAIQLERGIRLLLDDPSGLGVTKELFDHSLLYGLFAGAYDPSRLRPFRFNWRRGVQPDQKPMRLAFGTTMPSYIPSRNFALALLHLVARSGSDGNNGVLSMEAVRANTLVLPDGRLKQALLVALGEAKGDLDRARASLEALFDGTMDRVSGWYKRETQWVLLFIGLLLAGALNIDSLSIVRDLATNNALRQTLIARVDFLYPNQRPADLSNVDLGKQIEGLSDVIGWARAGIRRDAWLVQQFTAKASNNPQLAGDAARTESVRAQLADHLKLVWSDRLQLEWRYWATVGLGWMLTGFAVSLGAPFWFDLLNKFMVIRSTVKPYEKSLPEGSADRGAKTPYTDPLAPAPALRDPMVAKDDAKLAPVVPIKAKLRLAFDMNAAKPGARIAFTSDGAEVPVPQDGFLELPLDTGVSHQLSATAQSDTGSVSWNKRVLLTPDDEAKPMTAILR